MLSDCCGVLVYRGDICTRCKEHCEPMEDNTETMKVLQLVLNGEPLSFTVGATDWADACGKFSATYSWFDDLMKNRDVRISFQEVGK